MSRSHTELTYLQSAVQEATPAGLVVVLYDLLIRDIEQALAALAAGKVEERAAHLKHAFLVLQQLEGSLDLERGEEAAKRLARFYAEVRSKLFEGHLKVKPEIFNRQVELLLDVRQAWQQVDKPNLESAAAPPAVSASARPAQVDAEEDRVSANWSA